MGSESGGHAAHLATEEDLELLTSSIFEYRKLRSQFNARGDSSAIGPYGPGT
jgi:hypothetical protein